MSRHNKNTPTLAQTLIALSKREPAFFSIHPKRLRKAVDDFYEYQAGLLGQHLVNRGEITDSQLEMALSKQADTAGDHAKSLEHIYKARSGIVKHTKGFAVALDDIWARLDKVFVDG